MGEAFLVMERFDFSMERFPVGHGADVRLTAAFSDLTAAFWESTIACCLYIAITESKRHENSTCRVLANVHNLPSRVAQRYGYQLHSATPHSSVALPLPVAQRYPII